MTVQAGTPLQLSPARGSTSTWWAAADRLLAAAGDWLNPILVKETRQALKSKQFTITFSLLLICSWAWTFLDLAMIGPDVYYGARGPELFAGYYIILAFPLMVIVPFGAFRSLAAEQEDRTYELLSITALNPRQIIRGKLGSAVLQMLIYLSAITPCLAFTYMLRGIDFPTILFIIFYTVLGSLALSVAALLASTLTAERHWQVVLSVVLIAGLLFALWIACFSALGIVSSTTVPFSSPEFWQANAAFMTGYISYFLLLFYAAAAQITFATDNRSTRLRIVMLAQQLLFTGWMIWLWIGPERGDIEVIVTLPGVVGLHWFGMGALMTGESPELSSRVKRNLPQSFLGRMFLTWFNPGPGTGYVFAVCGTLAALLTGLAAAVVAEAFGPWEGQRRAAQDPGTLLAFGVLVLSYVTIYLGVGLLLMRLLRRLIRVSILLSLLTDVLLLVLGIVVPLVVQGFSMEMRGSGYSLLHVTNPFWSSTHVLDVLDQPRYPVPKMGPLPPIATSLPPEAPTLLTIVPTVALIVFLLNLSGVAREVRHVRIARPKRVAEEDAALLALKKPPQPVHLSPWD